MGQRRAVRHQHQQQDRRGSYRTSLIAVGAALSLLIGAAACSSPSTSSIAPAPQPEATTTPVVPETAPASAPATVAPTTSAAVDSSSGGGGAEATFIGMFVSAMHLAIPDLSNGDASCLSGKLRRSLAGLDEADLEQGFENGQLPPAAQRAISDALTGCLTGAQLAELQQAQGELAGS